MAESRLIEILGSGCAKCEMLAKHAEEAAKALGYDYAVIKIKDPAAIARYGVMQTPALVVDGRVRLVGRVLTAERLKEFLK
jgi:small redox-active disulfide protein 2